MMKRMIWVSWMAVLLVLAGCQESPRQQTAAKAVDSSMLKVVTFNIRYGSAGDGPNRWELRREFVLEMMKDFQADVMGLQEVVDFQADAVREAMADYEMIVAHRDDGMRAGEACPILYRRDRFEPIDSGTFWFSDTPQAPGSHHWGNTLPRICTWAHLRDRASGKGIYVYNLHLDHESQPSREKSTALVAERISRRSTRDPVIIMGDFNARLDNPALQYLLKDDIETPHAPMKDAWRTAHGEGQPEGTFHGFSGKANPKTGIIDHILVSESVKVIEARIDTRSHEGRWPSDHFAVVAELEL